MYNKNKILKRLNPIFAVMMTALFLGYSLPSLGHNRGLVDWEISGGDPVIFLHADGRVVQIQNNKTKKFLKQGFEANRDDKRNVEVGSATGGPNWLFRPTEDEGYWYIINLKTGLYLTKDGGSRNVSNWGMYGTKTSYQWRLEFKDKNSPSADTPLYIINRLSESYLKQSGDNVEVPGDLNDKTLNREWFLTEAPDNYGFEHSKELENMLKLKILSVKAIKTSTGQDGATKVLFSGIDLAIDIGLGVATGGASAGAKAAAKTAAKTALKKGARAVSRKAVIAAAKAAAKKDLKKRIAKTAAKEVGKLGLDQTDLDEKATHLLEQHAKKAVGMSAGEEAMSIASDALDALSSEAIFNKIYPSSPDDLEIGVNGSAIFPRGGRAEGRKISSQDTLLVDKEFIFEAERGVDIHLIEYDYGSDNDSLGWAFWRMPDEPGWLEEFVKSSGNLFYDRVLISEDSEGSLYELTYEITPLNPQVLTRGRLIEPQLVRKRAKTGCDDREPGACHELGRLTRDYPSASDAYWRRNDNLADDMAALMFNSFKYACRNEGYQLACDALTEVWEEGCQAGRQWICDEITADALFKEQERERLAFMKEHYEKADAGQRAFTLRSDIRYQKKEECDRGDQLSCYQYATLLYEDAKTVEYGVATLGGPLGQKQRMWPESAAMFGDLCSINYLDSCDKQITVYEADCTLTSDPETCEKKDQSLHNRYASLCNNGDLDVCFNLANIYYNDYAGGSGEWDVAEQLFRKTCGFVVGSCEKLTEITVQSCLQGKASSCLEQGRVYKHGNIKPLDTSLDPSYYAKNFGQAERYYTLGCDLNEPSSCIELGLLIRDDEGGTNDVSAALQYFEKACDLQESAACMEYSQTLLKDKTAEEIALVSTDAESKFDRACALGLDAGCDALVTLSESRLINQVSNSDSTQSTNENTNQVTTTQQTSSSNNANSAQQPLTCNQIGQIYTQSGGEQTNLLVTNSGSVVVHVYWIGYDGQQQDYNGTTNPLVSIPAGQSTHISSAIGALYSVYDENSNCLTVVETAQFDDSVSVAGDMTATTTADQPSTIQQAESNTYSPTQKEDSCALLGQIASTYSDQNSITTFSNQTGEEVYLYWINFDGVLENGSGGDGPFYIISPDETLDSNSYIGDVFSVHNGQGNCLSVVQVMENNIVHIITE